MTVDELLMVARAALADDATHTTTGENSGGVRYTTNERAMRQLHREPVLARAIVALLGVGWPCGWPRPTVVHLETWPVQHRIEWPDVFEDGVRLTADDCRGLAAGLLAAADELDAATAAEREGRPT
jgi:hypothetical protein